MSGISKAVGNHIVGEAFQLWHFINGLDQKRQSANYPYRDVEIRFIIDHLQWIKKELYDNKLEEQSKQIGDVQQRLFDTFWGKKGDTEVLLVVNKAKDILHKLHEGELAEQINPHDTDIDSFPKYRNKTKKDQYMLVYNSRLLWLVNVLKEKCGEEYSEALLTTDHDHSEYVGTFSHISNGMIQKIDSAVSKGIINEKQSNDLLKKVIEVFCYCYFRPSVESEIEMDKLKKQVYKTWDKIEDKLDG